MPVIRASLKRGQNVRMTVNGTSMLPFVRDGDVVDLEPIHSPPAKGDVVLVHCGDERYVVHRVVRVDGEMFFLRGDGQRDCEGPFTLSYALGKVTSVYHNGRSCALGKGLWRWAGLMWIRCSPVNLYLLSVMIHAWRLFRTISPRERRVPARREPGGKRRLNQ